MSCVKRALGYLSVCVAVLTFLVFPQSANAQNGITSIPDLNGDGRADLLWYNPATGQTVAWLMDGTNASSSATLRTDPNWKIIKAADLNGDGMSDLVWLNASTGETAASIMNGTSISSWTTLLSVGEWKVIEAADFNGDRKADLLWYNASTGQTALWIMNGTGAMSWTVLLTDPDWKVIGTADLNGDGMADLLWYNASIGQTAAWIMNGTSVSGWAPLLTDPDWKVIGTADLNGDGMADLLWYNASIGQTAAWLMNGLNATAWNAFPATPDMKIIAAADVNGDRKADLLWRNNVTGQTSVWLMNGLSVSATASLEIDPNWTIASTGDIDNDGKADLLWYNSSTGQTSAWQMNGTSATNGTNLFVDPSWRLRCIKPTSLTASMACDDTVFTVASGSMPFNQAPIVNAGADQTITLPALANLSGNVSDDGAPIALLITTWSQVSGPGSVTFGNSANLQTMATFSIAGTYTLRLTVNDTAYSTSDDVVIVVNAAGSTQSNKAPVVNAGPDQTVTLSSGANLLGAVSDDGLPSGSSVTKSWSKISGPGTVTFGNPSGVTTTAAFSASGSYTLRLTASDTLLSSSDDVIIVVNAAATNQAPVVNAGADQMITFPASATLAGSASDDGLPAGSSLTRTWTKVSGPGTVTFGNASSLNSTATFSVAGSYTLRLTVSDGALSSTDNVVIVVSPPAATNQAPVVNAGADKTIVFPAGTTLTGTATDDGLPTGSSLSVSWTKVSGPGTVVFVNANALSASATFAVVGTYTLRLTATDGFLTSTDDVVVTVNSTPANQAPVVNAGLDQTITFPSAVLMAGSATDDGLPTGSTLTKTWSKVSGPGTVTFANTSQLNTTATFSVAGSYPLRLTANDSALTSTDDLIVVVNAAAPIIPGKDLFMGQNAIGSGNGSDCSNTLPISFFNNAINWGSGAGQIGPGTIVHLCGTLTTAVTFQGSGSAGNVIVLTFEPGAKFSQATWPNNTAVVTASNRSFIEIDGGVTCGETAFGVTTVCNGKIEATSNGSTPTYANHNFISGIRFTNCTNCRVHNLEIGPLFVKDSADTQGNGTIEGVTISQSSNYRIDHNVIHDAFNAIYGDLTVGESNFEIDHNILYRNNWSTGWSPVGTGNVTNLLWHDNESYDWSNWDDLTKGPGAGNFHSDGLHLFTNNLTGSVIGLQAYNNYFHGNPGTRLTAGLYYEGGGGTIVSPKSFNNVFSFSINVASNAYIVSEYQVTGSEAYNNTFIGVGTNNGVGIQLEAGATGGTSKNNIFTGLYLAYDDADSQLTTSNYNDFYNNRAIGRTAGANTTLSSWKTATGADNNSTSSNPNLDTSFKPQAGSQVIGVGTNLTGLGIAPLNNDKNGIPRSSSGSWTIGASE